MNQFTPTQSKLVRRRELYTCPGKSGVTADGSVPESFEDQFRLAIANLEAVLGGAALSVEDIVKLTFYLTNSADLPKLREIRRELLAISPAVTTLVISQLAGPDLLIEVEAVAAGN